MVREETAAAAAAAAAMPSNPLRYGRGRRVLKLKHVFFEATGIFLLWYGFFGWDPAEVLLAQATRAWLTSSKI